MLDFRDNFGNFSSCFAIDTEPDPASAAMGATDRFGNPIEESKGGIGAQMWTGGVEVTR